MSKNFPLLSTLGITNYEVPPPKNLRATLTHRHPLSDPKEFARKAETQCQHCFKSKADGVTLFKCTGCKTDIYCSKECQKLAWPRHRTMCKGKRAIPQDTLDVLRPLRAFTAKHRPTLCMAGVLALGLDENPANALQSILLVEVRARPGPTRTEQAYYVTGAAVVSYATLIRAESIQAIDMALRIHEYSDQHKARGLRGAFFVVLNVVDKGVANITPVGWNVDFQSQNVRGLWKEWLVEQLNEGIVN